MDQRVATKTRSQAKVTAKPQGRGNKRRAKKRPPTYAQLRRAARDLLPLVEAEAGKAEKLYHLTDKVVGEFRKSGLSSFLIPKALGGSELMWVDAMRIVEEVSRADGSTGWCLMVNGVMGASAGAFLPDKGARKIYPKADVSMAGHGVPRGYAKPVDGGYLIKGNWGYGSTIYHAEWIHTGCFISDDLKTMRLDEHGHPTVIIAHHPRSTIELKGNWDVHGLRGTGSYDYVTKGNKELFVPNDTCYMFDNPTLMRGGIHYGGGLVVSTTWGHTSWALGVGRRVLDELAKLARDRVDAFGPMHEAASFRKSFADCEAKYRSARAFVYSAWEDLCETYDKGKDANVEQLALIRLAMRHLHDVVSETSTFAHKAARGVSLRPSVLQRAYRDIHSGTQHILLSDQIVEDCGKVLLGTTGKNAYWNVLGVVG
jgi:alkylation response protein AidB-like acyl-CoA dehydrogenase